MEITDFHVAACPWCHALVKNVDANAHGDWHRQNNFHAADCAWLLTLVAQRQNEAYLTPRECSCGLDRRRGHPTRASG